MRGLPSILLPFRYSFITLNNAKNKLKQKIDGGLSEELVELATWVLVSKGSSGHMLEGPRSLKKHEKES